MVVAVVSVEAADSTLGVHSNLKGQNILIHMSPTNIQSRWTNKRTKLLQPLDCAKNRENELLIDVSNCHYPTKQDICAIVCINTFVLCQVRQL